MFFRSTALVRESVDIENSVKMVDFMLEDDRSEAADLLTDHRNLPSFMSGAFGTAICMVRPIVASRSASGASRKVGVFDDDLGRAHYVSTTVRYREAALGTRFQ